MSKTKNVPAAAPVAAPVVETPVIETPTVETPTVDAPTPEPEPEPITLESLKKAWHDAMAEAAKIAAGDDFEAALKANLESYKAGKAVQDFINAQKTAEANKKLEAEIETVKSMPHDLIKLYDEFLAAKATYEASSKTDADKLAVDTVYATFVQKINDIQIALVAKMPKPVMHIAQGVNGKKLAAASTGTTKTNGGTGIGAEVVAHIKAGKTKDELLKMGYADGTIRSAQWKVNTGRA